MGRRPIPRPPCLDCGTKQTRYDLPHGRLCRGCKRRRHYHPRPCPGCEQTRPLAWPSPVVGDAVVEVCAGCAGAESIFACIQCGAEDHPYSYIRCARCYVTNLLTDVLTDPTTGQIHARLVPVFELLTSSRRPQTTYWWLTRPGAIAPTILAAMATGELAISHDTFRTLPMDRRHVYLRDLLTSTGVLEPYSPQIERIEPWLATITAAHPAEHAEVLTRFARWHILRRLRRHATRSTLTSAVINKARSDIRAASRLLSWLEAREQTITAMSQTDLEAYLALHPGARSSARSLLNWLHASGINTSLTHAPYVHGLPQVTMSDQARWAGIELLLHETTINSHSRVAGLFLLLFAWPLNKVLRMTHDQIDQRADGRVFVTFEKIPIELPPLVGPIVAEHMDSHCAASYDTAGTDWLFPGRHPGRPIVTETVRRTLVSNGIHPRASRSAAMFALASQIPPAVLAELTGMTVGKAVAWSQLAARDWSNYIAHRRPRTAE